MEIIRGLHNLKPSERGCVATIGNFDGVHRGHQAVIAHLAEQGKRLQLPVTVVTFEPQPMEFFAPESAPPRLTRFREKVTALAELPVDRVVCLVFNRRLAALSAEAFMREVLVERLGVRYLVVGDDFRFGCGRKGDFELLVSRGPELGFQVTSRPSFLLDSGRVSSTAVREALGRGDLENAARLLGRPYAMAGRVAHGDKRGRSIGFPTANIRLHRKLAPVEGVFAVQMHGVAEQPLAGVANVGVRPTVDGQRSLLEVHLLDFSGDLYGRHVQVEFLHRLREERRFESFDALRIQIERDVVAARDYFAAVKN